MKSPYEKSKSALNEMEYDLHTEEKQEQEIWCSHFKKQSIAHRIDANPTTRSQSIVKPFTRGRNSRITSPHEIPTRTQLLLSLLITKRK
jgi:hypothetical protein